MFKSIEASAFRVCQEKFSISCLYIFYRSIDKFSDNFSALNITGTAEGPKIWRAHHYKLSVLIALYGQTRSKVLRS